MHAAPVSKGSLRTHFTGCSILNSFPNKNLGIFQTQTCLSPVASSRKSPLYEGHFTTSPWAATRVCFPFMNIYHYKETHVKHFLNFLALVRKGVAPQSVMRPDANLFIVSEGKDERRQFLSRPDK